MLEVLARFHPGTMTRSQIATAAQVKKTGGTFAQYWSTLRTNGLIEEEGGRDGGAVTITPAGFAAIGATPDLVPLTHDEIVAMWNSKLKAGARRMLEVLIDAYPSPVTRDHLGEAAGVTVGGGTFSQYLSTLRTNGLAVVNGEEVTAAEVLFP